MFNIGFPLDCGDENSTVVLVELIRNNKVHSCRGGGNSGLREDSGAAYVFERVAPRIREEYRFQFEIIPKPNNISSFTPRNICDIGSSDAVACALAVELYDNRPRPKDRPIVAVSVALCYSDPAKGLTGLKLEKVTNADPEPATKSLAAKWHAACRVNALALVLHQIDAELLCRELATQPQPPRQYQLSRYPNIFNQLAVVPPPQPAIVSCTSDDWRQLQVAMQPAKRRPDLGKVAGVIAIVCAIVIAIWAWHDYRSWLASPKLRRQLEQRANRHLNHQLFFWNGIPIAVQGRQAGLQIEVIYKPAARIKPAGRTLELELPLTVEVRVDWREGFIKTHGENAGIFVFSLPLTDGATVKWPKNTTMTVQSKSWKQFRATISIRPYAGPTIAKELATLYKNLLAQISAQRVQVTHRCRINAMIAGIILLIGIGLAVGTGCNPIISAKTSLSRSDSDGRFS